MQVQGLASGLQRLVRIEEGGTHTEVRFGSLCDAPFLVLLGEPGAGKTALLKEAERAGWGRRIECARFLAMSDQQRAVLQGKALFLDGLDEVRADPHRRDALDKLMTLAAALQPPRLWLTCRAAHWWHASDSKRLAWAELPTAVPQVATLQPLSDVEVVEILAEQGVEDIPARIAHMRYHRLDDLLRNPLTLTLVGKLRGELPSKRSALFEAAVANLVEEVNPEHRQHFESRNTEDVLDDAGLCCAVLLISGLSVIDRGAMATDRDALALSWAMVAPRLKARALPDTVMDTRLFVAEAEDRFRPIHRVIAEFLAARWIAKQATKGLTDNRLKVWLCGAAPWPHDDLRGLHAWVACLAPTLAARMVVRDPFGVLVNGDASMLAPDAKRALLHALRDADAEDPFFRHRDWRREPMAPLADPALTDDLRASLRERPVRDQFLSCVLDALVAGDPLPPLAPDLEALVRDRLVDGGTRLHALRTLCNVCKGDPDRLLSLYSELSATPQLDADFDLRAELIKTLYPLCVDSAAIAAFLISYARQSCHQLGDFLTWLAEKVPDDALADLLDGLTDLAPSGREGPRGVWIGVRTTIMRLILRRLPSLAPVDAPRLVQWLGPITRDDSEARHFGAELISILAKDLDWRIGMLTAVLRASQETERHRRHPWFLADWVLPRDSCGLTVTTSDAPAILAAARAECDAVVAEALYAIALWLALDAKPPRPDLWEPIWQSADRPEWRAARDAISVVSIEHLQSEATQQLQARRAERQASRERDRAILRQAVPSIAAGTDGNLKHLACVYLGLDSRVQSGVAPEQRIARLYDDEAIQDAALAGFVRCLEASDLRPPSWIGDRCAQGRRDERTHVWLCGACILWQQDRDRLLGLPAAKRSSLIALALTHWGMLRGDQEGSRWPWFDALVAAAGGDRLAGILDDLLRPQMAAGVAHPRGLNQLCHETGWEPARRTLCLPLARDFPAHPDVGALLDAAADCVSAEHMRSTIRRVLDEHSQLPADPHWVWLSHGWLIDPAEFDAALRNWVAADPDRIHALAELVPGSFGAKPAGRPLTEGQLITVLDFLARRANRADEPRIGMVFSYTPEHHIRDATRRAFTQLAQCATFPAQAALARMVDDPMFAAWNEVNRHALATCRRMRAQLEFSKPELPRLIDGLVSLSLAPATAVDAQAIVLDALAALAEGMRTVGIDPWRIFWNDPSRGSRRPKEENDCNQHLAELLEQRLLPAGIAVQVEAAQAGRTRCDIKFSDRGWVIPIEAKCHFNPEVWIGWDRQLGRQYAIEPKAGGFGVYVVYWFGPACGQPAPVSPRGTRPATAEEMQRELEVLLTGQGETRIVPVVLDVSPVEVQRKRGSAKRSAKANPARRSRTS